MMEAEQYDAIRQRVELRFRHRYAFFAHVAVYVLVSMLLWLVYGLTAGMAAEIASQFPIAGLYAILAFPWPLVIMAGWGIGLIAHGMNYYIRYGEGAIRRKEAINRAIEREMAWRMNDEKPKNDVPMRLTDDGELEVVEDEPSLRAKRKNQ